MNKNVSTINPKYHIWNRNYITFVIVINLKIKCISFDDIVDQKGNIPIHNVYLFL